MSYSDIENKLNSGKIIILDGGMGAELEKLGASMDNNLWSGRCSVDNPEIVYKAHQNFIQSGSDIITTNTYASTPISMKEYGYENHIEEWNKASVKIAKNVIDNSNSNACIIFFLIVPMVSSPCNWVVDITETGIFLLLILSNSSIVNIGLPLSS